MKTFLKGVMSVKELRSVVAEVYNVASSRGVLIPFTIDYFRDAVQAATAIETLGLQNVCRGSHSGSFIGLFQQSHINVRDACFGMVASSTKVMQTLYPMGPHEWYKSATMPRAMRQWADNLPDGSAPFLRNKAIGIARTSSDAYFSCAVYLAQCIWAYNLCRRNGLEPQPGFLYLANIQPNMFRLKLMPAVRLRSTTKVASVVNDIVRGQSAAAKRYASVLANSAVNSYGQTVRLPAYSHTNEVL